MKIIYLLFFIIFISYLIYINNKSKTFNVSAYIADNDYEREKGLMFVTKKLPENHGLLLKYNKNKEHSIWMKNTYIPLDIVFLDKNNKILDFIQNTHPRTLVTKGINKPSYNILELNGGWIKKYTVKRGDYICIKSIKKFFK